MISGINDEFTLAARLLLATLFLIFRWRKLRDFSGTINQMVQLGVPVPVPAAAVAIFMELPIAFAVAVGAFTRLSAALMALYALGTPFIGHRYWTVKGAEKACGATVSGGISRSFSGLKNMAEANSQGALQRAEHELTLPKTVSPNWRLWLNTIVRSQSALKIG